MENKEMIQLTDKKRTFIFILVFCLHFFKYDL